MAQTEIRLMRSGVTTILVIAALFSQSLVSLAIDGADDEASSRAGEAPTACSMNGLYLRIAHVACCSVDDRELISTLDRDLTAAAEDQHWAARAKDARLLLACVVDGTSARDLFLEVLCSSCDVAEEFAVYRRWWNLLPESTRAELLPLLLKDRRLCPLGRLHCHLLATHAVGVLDTAEVVREYQAYFDVLNGTIDVSLRQDRDRRAALKSRLQELCQLDSDTQIALRFDEYLRALADLHKQQCDAAYRSADLKSAYDRYSVYHQIFGDLVEPDDREWALYRLVLISRELRPHETALWWGKYQEAFAQSGRHRRLLENLMKTSDESDGPAAP